MNSKVSPHESTGGGTDSTLSKLADDTEVCGADNTIKGTDGIQRNSEIQRCAHTNLMKFKKAKCKAMQPVTILNVSTG